MRDEAPDNYDYYDMYERELDRMERRNRRLEWGLDHADDEWEDEDD